MDLNYAKFAIYKQDIEIICHYSPMKQSLKLLPNVKISDAMVTIRFAQSANSDGDHREERDYRG